MKKYTALDLLFETALRHMYQAEKAVVEGLDTLTNYALTNELKNLFQEHKVQTNKQIQRLDQIFKVLEIDINESKLQGLPGISDKAKEFLKTLMDLNFSDRSKSLEGLLAESDELIRHFSNTDAGDLALVNIGLRIEHFEIASYRFLCFFSRKIRTRFYPRFVKSKFE